MVSRVLFADAKAALRAARARCFHLILHAPGRQSSFSPYRIILDPIDRLPGEPCGSGDLANACGLPQHRLRTLELLAAVARLAPLRHS